MQTGDMHRKGDFDIDMMERPELWNQKIKLGVLPNGRYGIGRAAEVGDLRRRVRNSMLIAPLVQSTMMMAPMIPEDREKSVGMTLRESNGTTGAGSSEKIGQVTTQVQEAQTFKAAVLEETGQRDSKTKFMRKRSYASKMSANNTTAIAAGSGTSYETAPNMSDMSSISEDSLQIGANTR